MQPTAVVRGSLAKEVCREMSVPIHCTSERDKSRVGLWGEYSFRVERQRERPWGLGVFRVSWLGITVIVIGKFVLTVTRPVPFRDGEHRA